MPWTVAFGANIYLKAFFTSYPGLRRTVEVGPAGISDWEKQTCTKGGEPQQQLIDATSKVEDSKRRDIKRILSNKNGNFYHFGEYSIRS